MQRIPFRKMHGLGNDFVVLDRRRGDIALAPGAARILADRHIGIGCDQLIVLECARRPAAQVFMRILNADGSEAEACGNGTRCIARLVAEETGDRRVQIETLAGLLTAELLDDGRVAVDMGPARTGWGLAASPPPTKRSCDCWRRRWAAMRRSSSLTSSETGRMR